MYLSVFFFCFWIFSLVLTQLWGLSFIFHNKNVCSNNFSKSKIFGCVTAEVLSFLLSLSHDSLLPGHFLWAYFTGKFSGSSAGLGRRLFPSERVNLCPSLGQGSTRLRPSEMTQDFTEPPRWCMMWRQLLVQKGSLWLQVGSTAPVGNSPAVQLG